MADLNFKRIKELRIRPDRVHQLVQEIESQDVIPDCLRDLNAKCRMRKIPDPEWSRNSNFALQERWK